MDQCPGINRPAQGWRVFCCDGSTVTVYDSVNHTVADIPATVQVVVWYYDGSQGVPVGRDTSFGCDCYEVDGTTIYGLEIDFALFRSIVDQADAATEMP